MKGYRFNEFFYEEIPETVWDAWADCARRWRAEPFRAPTWMRGLPWAAGSLRNLRLLTATDARDDRIGFWPYQLVSRRARGILPVRVCRPWGDEKGIDPGVSSRIRFWALCSPDPPPGFAAAFVRAFLERTRWNVLQTGELKMGDPLLPAWEDALAERRLPFRRRVKEDGVLPRQEGFDPYLSTLGRLWRKAYRKIQREQLSTGRFRIELQADFPGDALERAVARIAAVYRGSWKTSAGDTAVNLSSPEVLAAFVARMAAFARSGGLHVLFVTVDGEDAAFDVCVRHGDMFCGLQTAYLEKYAPLGVGFLAIMESNRYMIEQGMHEINQLGYADYMQHHGAVKRESVSYEVFSRDAAGRLLWGVRAARRLARASST